MVEDKAVEEGQGVAGAGVDMETTKKMGDIQTGDEVVDAAGIQIGEEVVGVAEIQIGAGVVAEVGGTVGKNLLFWMVLGMKEEEAEVVEVMDVAVDGWVAARGVAETRHSCWRLVCFALVAK
ncbi:hypothetical protein U1Q18_020444 [Sarracenia purpurea var. burkii]